jgi:tetratricopeptide (TPR) repeat protein
MADDEDIPMLEAVESKFSKAAGFLDRAASSGCSDPAVTYMLALAHKRDGRIPEARAAFRKIPKPDANIVLQMALLSLSEGNLAQAEEEFAKAAQMNPNSFAAAYNLALTRLSLAQFEQSRKALSAAASLAPNADMKRVLTLLDELVSYWRPESPGGELPLVMLGLDSMLETLSQADEQALIKVLRGLGNLEAMFQLVRTLYTTRPHSQPVTEAYYECALARARDLIARSRWTETVFLLEPLAREKASRSNQALLHNLLGCCAFVTSDFDRAVNEFLVATKHLPSDPRIRQNLALALERSEQTSDAEEHWTRFLELLDGTMIPTPPDVPRYTQALEYETLIHLANVFQATEKWTTVLNYLNRAARIKPEDPDLMERMFHVYVASKQPNRARKLLDDIRRLRPNDPQLDLYELDLVEVKNLSDIERLLTEIEHILRRYPDDHRVNERAVNMVGNVIPLMGNLCDQLTDQLSKVMNQVSNLPRFQVDWSALREILRDLMKEFQKLRRITGKCLPLVTSDEHKRIVRDLMEHIDKKIDACRELGA